MHDLFSFGSSFLWYCAERVSAKPAHPYFGVNSLCMAVCACSLCAVYQHVAARYVLPSVYFRAEGGGQRVLVHVFCCGGR